MQRHGTADIKQFPAQSVKLFLCAVRRLRKIHDHGNVRNVSDLFNDLNDDSEEKSNDIVENEESYNSVNSGNGVPVDEVERVCHKVEFCGKIINNDGIRAKLEIKNIVDDLKELIRAYGK